MSNNPSTSKWISYLVNSSITQYQNINGKLRFFCNNILDAVTQPPEILSSTVENWVKSSTTGINTGNANQKKYGINNTSNENNASSTTKISPGALKRDIRRCGTLV